MRDQAVAAIIHQDPRPATHLELTYMLDYNLRLGFIMNSCSDPRFDPLTPPSTLFADLTLGFYATFRNDSLEFANADKSKCIGYVYDQNSVALIESLETGVIGRELAALLRRNLHVDGWEDGHMLCEITDFRFSRPVGCRQMMKVAESVIFGVIAERGRYGRRDAGMITLEVEQQVLAIARPVVCVDPSPDVARVHSAAHWRRQVWRRGTKLGKEAMAIAVPVKPVVVPPTIMALAPITGPVVIPDAILHALTPPKPVKAE
jgi:hypothetical protein